jgi:hypothetical protein
MGKLLAEKSAIANAVAHALGPWCKMKGVDSKEIGENNFLFTFHKTRGKKKVVDNRPWMFNKDLIVL